MPGPSVNIFATCDIGKAALARVRAAGLHLEVHGEPLPPTHACLLRAVQRRGLVGLLTTLRDPIGADLLETAAATGVRVVAQCAVGLDNIDVEAATRLGIVVTHTPEVLTAATAEFAIFALGALARKLAPSEQLVRRGEWSHWHPYLPFLGREVHGMTIGVIGLGRIGRAFAARCVGLDVDLLLHDPRHEESGFVAALQAEFDLRLRHGLSREPHSARFVDLPALLEQSDAISLHVPLRPGTQHLIDRAALQRMKPTALLVNTARGAVVDEIAVAKALRRGEIAGAALDVFAREPLPQDSPLLDPALDDRLRLFHHFGSGTERTRLDPDPDVGMAGRAVAGLLAVLQPERFGDPRELPYVVNPEVLGE
jgi:lactate dehydrogenase-like 2-hydroxyacid dehydrogenase